MIEYNYKKVFIKIHRKKIIKYRIEIVFGQIVIYSRDSD